MNMLARWRKNDPDFAPIGLDEDFERECKDTLAVPAGSTVSDEERFLAGLRKLMAERQQRRENKLRERADHLQTIEELDADIAKEDAFIAGLQRSMDAFPASPLVASPKTRNKKAAAA